MKIREQKAIAVVTLPVAELLFTYSRYTFPAFSASICNMSMDTKMVSNIRQANLIIWDEIVMCARSCVEAADQTLRLIMKSPNVPFGGSLLY